MKRAFFIFLILLASADTSFGQIEILKDIQQGGHPNATGDRRGFFPLGSDLLFFYDQQLFKTNASATQDIYDFDTVGGGGFVGYGIYELNSLYIFTVDTDSSGKELYVTDGSTAGTKMLADINPGPAHAFHSFSLAAIEMNSELYFAANNGVNGFELWKTDGTASGTVMVKDVYTGVNGSLSNSLSFQPIVNGGKLFFLADDGTNGHELWVSDGTTAGTTLLKDIVPGSLSPFNYASFFYGQNKINVGSDVYFSANDGSNGTELWKTNGTTSGTIMVKDINTGSVNGSPANFIVYNSDLYFTAVTASNGKELWTSDGTTSGTQMVKDIYIGTNDGCLASFKEFGGELFFCAQSSYNNEELWKTDGTTSGTVLVKDFKSAGGSKPEPGKGLISGGDLYFHAKDNSGFYQLCISDGSATGSFSLGSINNMAFFPGDNAMIEVAGKVIFDTRTSAYGREYYTTDGSIAGTSLLKDINGTSFDSNIDFVFADGSYSYFSAETETTGKELYRTDGTSLGTILLSDFYCGTLSGLHHTSGYEPKILGNHLYVLGSHHRDGNVLIKTHTTTGTMGIHKDLSPSNYGSVYWYFAETDIQELNDKLIFLAADSAHGYEFWTTDGTASGTTMLAESIAGCDPPLDLSASGVTADKSLYYVGKRDASSGIEPWISDGTASGTQLLKDINPGSGSSSPSDFTAACGGMFFTAFDGTTGRSVFFSNGTSAGTVKLFSAVGSFKFTAFGNKVLIHFGSNYRISDGTVAGTTVFSPGVAIYGYGVYKDTLYLSGYVASSGLELYKSDGTLAGTSLLIDINTGPGHSYPGGYQVFQNELYFMASTPSYGFELYKTDGTSAGTVLVKDMNVGAGNSSIYDWAVDAKRAYFSCLQSGGRELWTTDGTSAGTYKVVDLNPSGPEFVRTGVVNDGMLYFTGQEAVGITDYYKSDGTASGTSKLTFNDSTAGTPFAPSILSFNDIVLMVGLSDSMGQEIYSFSEECSSTSNLPTNAGVHTSTMSKEGGDGWLYHCNTDGELLLALDTINTGIELHATDVSLEIGATTTTTWTTAGGIIGNSTGGGIINRKWEVNPMTQPSSDIPVRYYFTNDEYNDLKTAMANHNGGAAGYPSILTSPTMLDAYKLTSAGPFGDPHAVSATGVVLDHATTPSATKWHLTTSGTKHQAEFEVTSFSGGGIGAGGGNQFLAVDLLAFDALPTGRRSALLTWTTAGEEDNSHFEVERSFDNKNFMYIGKVEGGGSISSQADYTYGDNDIPGTDRWVYYRLKQVDFDGSYVYTDIRPVQFANGTQVVVYPNPGKDVIYLSGIEQKGVKRFRLYSSAGVLIKEGEFDGSSTQISTSELNAGSYILTIHFDHENAQFRWTKISN